MKTIVSPTTVHQSFSDLSQFNRSIKRTTGIGSLPHHNIDAALDYSFKMGIPFLPQIPVRNPRESMIAQALEGLPGLELGPQGSVFLNIDEWASQSHLLSRSLERAFSGSPDELASGKGFEEFEPSPTASSCWRPFLWELQERQTRIAKVQIAGPLTSQWGLRVSPSAPDLSTGLIELPPELSTQIFRLILAKSLALVNRLLSFQIQPILFLDEPGLFALSPKNPKHVLGLQELKLLIQTLRKQGAWIGLHCCSNADWKSILALGIDFLSIDTSLDTLLSLDTDREEMRTALETFIQSGGKFSLGIIPTTPNSTFPSFPNLKKEAVLNPLPSFLNQKTILSEALFTPACGLALQSTSDAELILEKLLEAYEYYAFK